MRRKACGLLVLMLAVARRAQHARQARRRRRKISPGRRRTARMHQENEAGEAEVGAAGETDGGAGTSSGAPDGASQAGTGISQTGESQPASQDNTAAATVWTVETAPPRPPQTVKIPLFPLPGKAL